MQRSTRIVTVVTKEGVVSYHTSLLLRLFVYGILFLVFFFFFFFLLLLLLLLLTLVMNPLEFLFVGHGITTA